MHIYFSGIGGAGVGPLALIAHQAGYTVSGSDKQDTPYTAYLQAHGVHDIHIGQSYEAIAVVHARQPIDWFVYTSALTMEQSDPPELRFCTDHDITATKRDAFLSQFLRKKQLPLIAIAGTHGKTTTTAMAIWACKQLGLPVSYSVGAKLSFGEMGEYHPASKYFIYEADEFDRNFLAFTPHLSIITGIDWDHPDIYPTRQEYNDAFRQFLDQSEQSVLWNEDLARLGLTATPSMHVLDERDAAIDHALRLPGKVNRLNAWQVAHALHVLTNAPLHKLMKVLNDFPGVSRRFEELIPHLYSDYAHTIPKIRGALQMAHEVAGDRVVVVYEGLHNTRQHFIKDELKDVFDDVQHLYIVPSYLAREDERLAMLTPQDLKHLMSPRTQAHTTVAMPDDELAGTIRSEIARGNVVLCLSAGGGDSLDTWLRTTFQKA